MRYPRHSLKRATVQRLSFYWRLTPLPPLPVRPSCVIVLRFFLSTRDPASFAFVPELAPASFNIIISSRKMAFRVSSVLLALVMAVAASAATLVSDDANSVQKKIE